LSFTEEHNKAKGKQVSLTLRKIDPVMRIFLYMMCLCFSIALLNGCKATGGSSTKASAEPAKQESADSETQAREWMGRDIVSETVSRLINRLSVSGDPAVRIKTVITQSFTDSGGDLHASYSDEEARKRAKDIVRMSSDEIMQVLDEQQKKAFRKLLSKK
jgi:hypothetical protein